MARDVVKIANVVDVGGHLPIHRLGDTATQRVIGIGRVQAVCRSDRNQLVVSSPKNYGLRYRQSSKKAASSIVLLALTLLLARSAKCLALN